MADDWEEYEAQKAQARADVEQWGERKVRQLLATNSMPGSHLEAAEEWIASLGAAVSDAKEAARAASHAEQMRIARSAKNAAWAAAIAAIIAAICAIIAVLSRI